MDARELAELNRRLEAIEWNLNRLLNREGLAWEEPAPVAGIPDDVLELVRSGNAIGAIKRYREHTGVGLAEAKAIIDPLV